ncbi:hypothetical protein SDC9_171867 [bioreactor metagenome]|uniref:Uncharacterized protein n=1 Tax=bioreactor metagenome TaxID=1076179 RepID=A0A645GC19_9ZZZZ
MGKVPAMSKIQTHKSVAWLEARHEHRHVCLCSGMGLDIGVFGIKQLAQPVDGQLLYLVHDLTSSIVTGSRISLCVFVCKNRTKCRKHLRTYKVL